MFPFRVAFDCYTGSTPGLFAPELCVWNIWLQDGNVAFQNIVFNWVEDGFRAAYQVAGILEVLQVIRGWQGAGVKDFACQTGEPDADAPHLLRTVKLLCYGGAEFVSNTGLE